MEDNMDIDLSPIVRGEKTYQEMGREMVNAVRDICNGKMTKAETFGFSDIAVDHVCRFVWLQYSFFVKLTNHPGNNSTIKK